ncbi:MAG: P-type conjugative transfer protein TrbJ [Bacteroidales bacterium]|nr:P-type conjugative transfer protein TrbJ [Bacteroidales bacterium]
MKQSKRIFTSFITASALVLSTANAGSVGGFGGASEITQLANNSQLAAQYGKQLQQYATQIQQYQTSVQQFTNQVNSYKLMLQNIGQLPQTQWNQFASSVSKMKQILDNTSSMTYTAANYDQLFKKLYPKYDTLLASGQVDPTSVYKGLSNQTNSTVNDALKQLNLSQSDLESDTSTMRELQNVSQSAVGQLSAVQAANEIALHQTNTLKRLHQTMMMQANMQAQAIAASQAKEDAARADFDKFNQRKVNININDSQNAGGRQW